jgi:uncharacterized membrane protein
MITLLSIAILAMILISQTDTLISKHEVPFMDVFCLAFIAFVMGTLIAKVLLT